jgi:hypothetical protein
MKAVKEFMKSWKPYKAITPIAVLKNQSKISKMFLVIFCDIHIDNLWNISTYTSLSILQRVWHKDLSNKNVFKENFDKPQFWVSVYIILYK